MSLCCLAFCPKSLKLPFVMTKLCNFISKDYYYYYYYYYYYRTHVRLGDYDLESTDDGASPVDYFIREVRMFNYNEDTYQNDIIIIVLPEKIQVNGG